MSVSIIVPCYNEEGSLPFFYEEFKKLATSMAFETFELILVDDGSSDNTMKIIREYAEEDSRICFISFSRNFGKEAAIYAGLKHSRGDYTVIMDADLQDPPSLFPEMYKAVTEEGYDSAATRRVTRVGEPPIRSFFARRFYHLMNRISNTELVDGARDYRLMNRKFLNAILSLGEYNRFSKGLFGWVGFKTKWIEFENQERVAGETKWSFWSLFVYAVNGVVAFSTSPLTISTILGAAFGLFAFICLIIIVIRRLISGDPVAGWASLVSVALFLGGIQLFCIGILGQYLAKTYLETKKRPIYIIGETNLKDGQTED